MKNETPALPSGWSWASPQELCSSDTYSLGIGPFGSNLKVSDYQDSGVPLIFVRNIRSQVFDSAHERFISVEKANELIPHWVLPGDLLITKMGDPPGDVCIYPSSRPQAVLTADCIKLRPSPLLPEPKFLVYAFQSSLVRSQIIEATSGVAQQKISLEKFRSILLPVAPLEEQVRIVSELDKHLTRLDAGVAALKRAQSKLKRYRASVLKAACEGRLVPTEAELARAEGRDYEPADQLLARILQERRARWEAAQLAKMNAAGKTPSGESWRAKYQVPATRPRPQESLPEGWTWAYWDEIGFSQNGRSFPSQDYQSHGVPLLRAGNLHSSGVVQWTEDNTRSLPAHYAQQHPDFLVGPGELVMNLTAQSLKDEFLGRACMTVGDGTCLLNQRIARLTPVLVSRRFMLWLFKSPLFRAFVNKLNTGSLIQHMFTSQLAEFALPLPPLAEQERIVAELERRLSIFDALEHQILSDTKKANILRQSILKHAFEGKLVPQDANDEPAHWLLERLQSKQQVLPLPLPSAPAPAAKRAARKRTSA